jgi:sodium/proline symporter
VTENAKGLSGYLSLIKIHNTDGTASTYGGLTIVSTLAWGLGYFGMPHILLRFMAIRNEGELSTSRRIGSIWVVISMFAAILIGVIGNAVSKAGGIAALATSAESETVVIKLAELLGSHGVVLALLAGVIMAGILACTMSTADSQLLAAASSVSQNLLQDCFKIKMSQKTAMVIARITVIAVAIVGIILAWNPESSVFKIVSFAWAGFGAAFGPLMLLSLFWKRCNKWGALAGMVAGGVMVFVWKFLIRPIGGGWDIYELLPAFIVALVAIVAVSLLTKAPSDEIVKEFEEVKTRA